RRRRPRRQRRLGELDAATPAETAAAAGRAGRGDGSSAQRRLGELDAATSLRRSGGWASWTRRRRPAADAAPAEAKEERRLEEENAKLKKLVAQFAMEVDSLKAALGKKSFSGRFRVECLAQARFPILARARVEIELWRVDDNTERPHSALDDRTPTAFGELVRRKVPASPGAAAAFVRGRRATWCSRSCS